jgi:hypothetical protein
MGILRSSSLATLCLASLTLGSCSTDSGSIYVRRTSSAANDHIMLVRQDPMTFGYKRLSGLSQIYPDLQIFLHQQGAPEFLAETTKGGNHYLILYYLKSREAFACRSGDGNSREVEFSGPYPVTDREAATLNALKQRSQQSASR